MNSRKWYRKKRYWLFILFIIWILVSRLGFANFMYDPLLLEDEIRVNTYRITNFKTIPFEDSEISYIKVGNRDTLPLIVFVHGSPGTLTASKNYLLDNRLHDRADIISIDRLGFGYSEYGNAEPGLQRQADMLVEILKSFPERKIILVGHSMGGAVLAKYAMSYSQNLIAVVFVAPSISASLEPSNSWRKVFNIQPICWMTPPAFRVCNQEIIPLGEELMAIEDQWDCIKVPVTIIHGSEDLLVPVGNAYFADSILVNSALLKLRIIEGGNHFIFWNEHDIIVDEVIDLLDSLD